MHVGVTLRNMGPQSSLETLLDCARAAESAALESVWITDHIAIPPDDLNGDIHASAAYRRQMAPVFVARALKQAAQRAG